MSSILIVDDDPTICLAMGEVLKIDGHQVETVYDGESALKLIQKTPFDLIILDIFMPEKDGFEIIGDVRRLFHGIKILAMSGYNEYGFDPLVYAQSLGADHVLSKPFPAEVLSAAIQELLD